MEAINEFTGMKITNHIYRFVVDIVDGIVICGYTNSCKNLIIGKFIVDNSIYELYFDPKKLKLSWSSYYQCYFYIGNACRYKKLVDFNYSLRPGQYNYSFDKKYEAVQHFDLFNEKQIKVDSEKFPISDYVNRTIGIEFETSLGNISEQDCFNYGLIPLRDGSISGIEYSTVVLQGNSGFNLLKKQLEILRSYTHFNKECALHIHFGDFPLDPDKIFNLYRLLFYIQDELSCYVPEYTFYTEKYKDNGKSYCKRLYEYGSFDSMYYKLTSHKFFGSFTQPHPADPTRTHKWNVSTRYYWCNFINLLCYNVNKTVEFRFLRPTYNLEKILTWIYILNAFLTYAEKEYGYDISISQIIYSVYPEDVAEMLMIQLYKLKSLKEAQSFNSDYIGSDLILENRFFDTNKII